MDATTLNDVIRWAAAAAREHVSLARHLGEDPDPETNMGLWQSFQHNFFERVTGRDRDLAITAYATTYAETVRAMVAP